MHNFLSFVACLVLAYSFLLMPFVKSQGKGKSSQPAKKAASSSTKIGTCSCKDVLKLKARMTAVEDAVNLLGDIVVNVTGTVESNTAAITELTDKVSQLETSVGECNANIEKLNNINKIWRSNFQVVNKTFAELRRKLKIVVPVIRFPVFVKVKG